MPPGKTAALARFASAARAQAVLRLPDDRRASTLVAFVRTFEASAGDDVIDLFHAVSTTMFGHAQARSKEARMRTLRDLDAAALKLRDAGAVLLDEATHDAEVRAAAFAIVDRETLASAIEQVAALARPDDDIYFAELREQQGKIHYLPALLAGLELDAAPRANRCSTRSRIFASFTRAANGPGRRRPHSRRKPGPGSSKARTARSTLPDTGYARSTAFGTRYGGATCSPSGRCAMPIRARACCRARHGSGEAGRLSDGRRRKLPSAHSCSAQPW